MSLSEEPNALFGFVEPVFLIVLAELVGPVGKLALVPVGTAPVLHELLAQLQLLLPRLPHPAVEVTTPGGVGWFGGGAV